MMDRAMQSSLPSLVGDALNDIDVGFVFVVTFFDEYRVTQELRSQVTVFIFVVPKSVGIVFVPSPVYSFALARRIIDGWIMSIYIAHRRRKTSNALDTLVLSEQECFQ